MGKSQVKIDKLLITKLDEVLPKLKYSVSYKKVIKWLENFIDADREKALEFLFYLEYIDFNELTYRLKEQIHLLVRQIPKHYRIILIPGAADYPKSPDLVNYVLKEIPKVKELQKIGRLEIQRDIFKISDYSSPTVLVLIDDFVGSGGSFKKAYDTKTGIRGWAQISTFIKEVALVSSIIMKKGQEFIEKNFPEVWIFAEARHEIFDYKYSPFRLRNEVSAYRKLAYKYGKEIVRFRSNAYGYRNSQSLVAFNHTAPNNTLPIIWSSTKWKPIFPRYGADKIRAAKELKREVAFYIGMMNRLGIDLFEDQEVVINGKTRMNYNHLEDHSLITILKLHIEGFQKPTICHMIGITTLEYNSIINIGKKRELFNGKGELSSTGHEYFRSLMKSIRSSKLRLLKRKKEDFLVKNVIYVPKKFKGYE